MRKWTKWLSNVIKRINWSLKINFNIDSFDMNGCPREQHHVNKRNRINKRVNNNSSEKRRKCNAIGEYYCSIKINLKWKKETCCFHYIMKLLIIDYNLNEWHVFHLGIITFFSFFLKAEPKKKNILIMNLALKTNLSINLRKSEKRAAATTPAPSENKWAMKNRMHLKQNEFIFGCKISWFAIT